jgi:transcriptional regulator with XRE-family HTH domain
MQPNEKINQIRAIMQKYNITQKELCDAMKIRHTSINKYFFGKRTLTDNMFLKIMKGLYEISNKRAQDWQSLHFALSQIKIEKEISTS